MNQSLQNWTNANSSSSLTYGPGLTIFWFIYRVLFTSGAGLNVMVIFVLLRSGKFRQNISSFLVFHLSVTHLLFHMTIPIIWNIHGPSGTSASCKIVMFIDFACAAAIFNSLVAIAWDRYRNILRPFESLALRNHKVYVMLVTVIWIYAFVTCSPFIFSVRTYSRIICSKEKNGLTETCRKMNFCHLPADWKTQLSKIVYFLLAFVIPLLYMFFAYTKIAVSLWKRNRIGTIHDAVTKRKVKSTRLIIIAVLGFVFCWGPKFFVDLLTVYGVFDETFVALHICSYLGQMSSSSINPLIYAFFSPEFRKSLCSYCCCCCCCSSRASVYGQRHRFSYGNKVKSVM